MIPPGVPPYRFDSNSTYVLSGGSGGLGRSLAHWMVRQGARNIIFLSRSGDKKPEARKTIEELVQKGAKVTAYSCDVGNAAEVEEIIRKSAEEYPPIRGVIQGAMVLKVCPCPSPMSRPSKSNSSLAGRHLPEHDA